MNSKVISEHWFTQQAEPATIGIIVTEDRITKERKARIGTGAGSSEIVDLVSIHKNGARVYPGTLRQIADLMDGKLSMQTCHADAELPESD